MTGSSNSALNMRVTANSSQGHRKYMEDCYKIRFQRGTHNQNETLNGDNESDILFSYFAIFDGHGGKEASQYCKEKLYWKIIEQDDFWSDNDSQILNAIRNGFVQCHLDMWHELPHWPKTPSGLPSTSGTTATVLFIKKSKAYVGHVGDSGLVIGFDRSQDNGPWLGKKLTRDHKPEDPIELKRIENSGGSVMSKSGVNRVVWNRPVFNPNGGQHTLKKCHSELISTSHMSHYEMNYQRGIKNVPTERIPFLAVARSLGDLWSYNVASDEFIVSPVPDVFSFELDPRIHKCLILATDGLWNMLKSTESVELVRHTDRETESLVSKSMCRGDNRPQPFVNPSQRLVNIAVQRCCEKMIRADNTSCITIMIDQPAQLDHYELDPNRTNFEHLLKQNKTMDFSRRLNDSDEMDDCYAELDEQPDQNYTKSFFNCTDFNTPLSNDKRSRSLVSLRRRHWSAGPTNRTLNNKNLHINTEDRRRREEACRPKRQGGQRSTTNMSTLSGFDRLSRNLRKSFNDLTSTKAEECKENSKKSEPNRHASRFKLFKNRLIRTKNNLLHRKRKLFNEASPNAMRLKSVSSPNLKMLESRRAKDKHELNNFLNVTTATNQSFVNNIKSKFAKRNQSSKHLNLNSTSITTKLSETNLNCGHDEQHTPSKRAKFY